MQGSQGRPHRPPGASAGMEGAGPAACASASPLRMNARDNKSGRWAAGLCVRRPAAHHPKMPRSPVLKCPRCALLLGRRADGRAENGVFQQSRVQNGAQRARGILACAAAQGAAHPGHRGAPCKAAGAPPPPPSCTARSFYCCCTASRVLPGQPRTKALPFGKPTLVPC